MTCAAGNNYVARAGFTAIEMMVVVSIVIILVAMVVPTIGPAMKKGSVHDAANAIQRACSMARQLARSNSEPRPGAGSSAPNHYGVAIVVPSGSEPAYAVVIYGTNPLTDYGFTSNPGNQYPNGTPDLSQPIAGGGYTPYAGLKPAAKYLFNKGVLPFKDDSAAPPNLPYTLMSSGSSVGWYYQYRTGFVFTDINQRTKAIDIGVAPVAGATVGKPQSFGVTSVDLKYKSAIAIYKIGLMNIQDMY